MSSIVWCSASLILKSADVEPQYSVTFSLPRMPSTRYRALLLRHLLELLLHRSRHPHGVATGGTALRDVEVALLLIAHDVQDLGLRVVDQTSGTRPRHDGDDAPVLDGELRGRRYLMVTDELGAGVRGRELRADGECEYAGGERDGGASHDRLLGSFYPASGVPLHRQSADRVHPTRT
jgi:hypothetical protein